MINPVPQGFVGSNPTSSIEFSLRRSNPESKEESHLKYKKQYTFFKNKR